MVRAEPADRAPRRISSAFDPGKGWGNASNDRSAATLAGAELAQGLVDLLDEALEGIPAAEADLVVGGVGKLLEAARVSRLGQSSRQIGEIGLQGKKVTAGLQYVVVATLDEQLSRPGERCFEVSWRHELTMGPASQSDGIRSLSSSKVSPGWLSQLLDDRSPDVSRRIENARATLSADDGPARGEEVEPALAETASSGRMEMSARRPCLSASSAAAIPMRCFS